MHVCVRMCVCKHVHVHMDMCMLRNCNMVVVGFSMFRERTSWWRPKSGEYYISRIQCRCVLAYTCVHARVCVGRCSSLGPLYSYAVWLFQKFSNVAKSLILCLRVLSSLLWICCHWLLFPWRLTDLIYIYICLPAVLIVTQIYAHCMEDSPQPSSSYLSENTSHRPSS